MIMSDGVPLDGNGDALTYLHLVDARVEAEQSARHLNEAYACVLAGDADRIADELPRLEYIARRGTMVVGDVSGVFREACRSTPRWLKEVREWPSGVALNAHQAPCSGIINLTMLLHQELGVPTRYAKLGV